MAYYQSDEFNGNQSQVYQQAGNQQGAYQKKSKRTLLMGISAGIVALAVVVAAILFFAFGGFGGARATAEKFMILYCKYDSRCVNYIAYTGEYKDEVDEIKSTMKQYKSMANLVELRYQVKSTSKVSKSDAQDFWNDNAGDIYVPRSDVRKLTKVTMKVTMSAFGEKQTEDVEVYVGKYKGKWKVIYTGNFN